MTGYDEHTKREVLREVAEDLRASDEHETEAGRLAAVVHRVSDLYDETEDTDPQHIYLNMKNILEISEQGGLGR